MNLVDLYTEQKKTTKLNLEDIKQIDQSEMYKIYDIWPKMAEDSYRKNFDCINSENINHIVFSGMGGSGIVGDIISAILSKTNIHITIVKGYLLPRTVDSQTLVVCLSSSGNTFETLSVLNSAHQLNCKIIAIASGGKIEEFCNKQKILFFKTNFYHSPRASLPTLLYSTLKILKNIIPIANEEIIESINNLKEIRRKIYSENLSSANPSLNLAFWLKEIPVIYFPSGLQAVAIRFKNSLQENSKRHAMIEDIIEASHNNVVAWDNKNNIQPIIIRGTDDHEKTKERWEILKKFFNSKDIDFWEISSINGNVLTKIISLIYILDFATLYLAINSKIDPTPIKPIDFIKSCLY